MNTTPFFALTIVLSSLILIGCDHSTPAAAESTGVNTATQNEPSATTDEPTYAHDDSDEKQTSYLQQSFSKDAMDELDLLDTVRKIHNKELSLAHQQIIFSILANISEVAIHQMRGETSNRVLVNKDGREAVYGQDDKLVTNGYNDGTYNYAIAEDEPLQHYTMDISPWILFGIDEEDPTTVAERIHAYMGDLEGGIVRAHKSLPMDILDEKHRWSDTGEIQALAIFFDVIEAGEAQELFALFESNTPPTNEQLISVLTKMNTGFDHVYGVSQP